MVTLYKTVLQDDNLAYLKKVREYEYALSSYSSAEEISTMMKEVFKLHLEAEELLYLLCFNGSIKLNGVFELSRGTANSTLFPQRELAQKVLLCNATAVVLVHNHPSGTLEHSTFDKEVCKELEAICKLIHVEFLDSIIVTRDSYCSYRE